MGTTYKWHGEGNYEKFQEMVGWNPWQDIIFAEVCAALSGRRRYANGITECSLLLADGKNIQKEMLDKINEAVDDKAQKISDTLSRALSVVRNYNDNEILYRYLDYEYGRDLEFLIQYQDAIRELFSNNSSIYFHQIGKVMIYTDNRTMLNSSYIRKLYGTDRQKLNEELTTLMYSQSILRTGCI